ncbi:uncharacterized protein [Diadema antillarum]|uniref:uncharacterized protein n=1 Tax=Diadema antillarum TaxID=105358 RepID=UPI003A880760
MQLLLLLLLFLLLYTTVITTITFQAEDRRHRTPLLLACERDRTEIAHKLIKHNADLTAWDENFNTPLHIVIRRDNLAIADDILEKAKATDQLRDLLASWNWNWVAPIHDAVRAGKTEFVRKCLDEALQAEQRQQRAREKRGEDVEDKVETSIVDLPGEDDNSLLHIAATLGNLDMVRVLVEKGAKVDSTNSNLRTPLHSACAQNHSEVVEYLVQKGASLEQRDADYLTALQIAANAESFNVVIALLDRIYNVNSKEDFETVTTEGGVGASKVGGSGGGGSGMGGSGLVDSGVGGSGVGGSGVGGSEVGGSGVGGSGVGRSSIAGSVVGGSSISGGSDGDETAGQAAAAESSDLSAIAEEGSEKLLDADQIVNESTDGKSDEKVNDSAAAYVGPVVETERETGAQIDEGALAEFIEWVVTENKAKVLKLLLRYRSKLDDVMDQDIDCYMMHAARNGHTDMVGALIRWKPDVVSSTDLEGKFPLHIAAQHGRSDTVQEILKSDANVNEKTVDPEKDSRDESADENSSPTKSDGKTALHYAAANGCVKTVQALLKAGANIDSRDTQETTPLHLACDGGNFDAVKLLLFEYDADYTARDENGYNCLDFAVDNEQENVANLLLSHPNWRQLMHSSTTDKETKRRSTPMRKLIAKLPAVAQTVMDKCLTAPQGVGRKNPDFWVEFEFELIDDSFSAWDHPDFSHKAQNTDKKDGLGERRFTFRQEVGIQETSFGGHPPDGKANAGYTPGVDDVESQKLRADGAKERDPMSPLSTSAYKENGRLKSESKSYTGNSAKIVRDHPLSEMVSAGRAELLDHPLTRTLVNHKWRHLVRYFFWTWLAFYLAFVALVTGYVVVTPPPYYAKSTNGDPNSIDWFANGQERWVDELTSSTRHFFAAVGHWLILAFSVLSLFREVILMAIERQYYFRVRSMMVWTLHILTILLVIPSDPSRFGDGMRLRRDWQWQCGSVAVFLAWINLLLFLRHFSVFGIYVIMLTEIMKSFLKFVKVFLIFLLGFALVFYMLLMNQQPFHRVQHSLLKTLAMMADDLTFDALFHRQNYLGTENTEAMGEDEYFLASAFYRGITYAMFALFVVVMTTLIGNLLVGVAVYDVQKIRQRAKFHHLAIQVETVLEMQRLLPVSIWRSVMVARKRLHPYGGGCCPGVTRCCRKVDGDAEILKEATKICVNSATTDGEPYKERLSSDQFYAGATKKLDDIDRKVDSATSDQSKKDLNFQRRFDRLERKVDALLSKRNQRVKLEAASDSNREAAK